MVTELQRVQGFFQNKPQGKFFFLLASDRLRAKFENLHPILLLPRFNVQRQNLKYNLCLNMRTDVSSSVSLFMSTRFGWNTGQKCPFFVHKTKCPFFNFRGQECLFPLQEITVNNTKQKLGMVTNYSNTYSIWLILFNGGILNWERRKQPANQKLSKFSTDRD